MTSRDTTRHIFSRALEDGPLPSGWPDGQGDLLGQAHAPASHFRQPESSEAPTTSATCGPSLDASLRSARLQWCLANKLVERLDGRGSPLFKMTWKYMAMPSRGSILQRQATALHTSGSASGGLPTPSGTSNHGKNHTAGRLDEWGGSSNPFRGTSLGRVHCPAFELWVMGFPEAWAQLMPPGTQSSRRSRQSSSEQ